MTSVIRGASLLEACHHEAGHACVSIWRGRLVKTVEVERTPKGEFVDKVQHEGWLVPSDDLEFEDWKARCWGPEAIQMRTRFDDDLAVLLAGQVAQIALMTDCWRLSLSAEERLGVDLGARDDLRQARRVLKLRLGADAQAIEHEIRSRHEQVVELVRARWPEIQGVAALVRRARVSGALRLVPGEEVHAFLGVEPPSQTAIDYFPTWDPPNG